MIVIAVLGVISPFLPYITDDYDSISGWDSREYFSLYEEFSAGPILVLLGSLFVLLIGIAVVVGQSNGTPPNKVACGVIAIVSGLVIAASGGASYQAWDNVLYYEGFVANQGAGLWLAVVCGIASIVLGVVALAVPSFTQGKN